MSEVAPLESRKGIVGRGVAVFTSMHEGLPSGKKNGSRPFGEMRISDVMPVVSENGKHCVCSSNVPTLPNSMMLNKMPPAAN
jgi:hypothetical protein